MKNFLYVMLMLIISFSALGCSDKKITIYDEKTKQTTTMDAESFYYIQQVKRYEAYLDSRANPGEIASITDPTTGHVISIKNQTAPPLVDVKQHKNQWVGPVMGFFDNLAKYGFYGFSVKTIADIFEDNDSVNITNSGSGSITNTRSEGHLNQNSGWVDDNSNNSDNRTDYDKDSSQTTNTEESNTDSNNTTTTTDTVTTTPTP